MGMKQTAGAREGDKCWEEAAAAGLRVWREQGGCNMWRRLSLVAANSSGCWQGEERAELSALPTGLARWGPQPAGSTRGR